jgi:hypothetical protein
MSKGCGCGDNARIGDAYEGIKFNENDFWANIGKGVGLTITTSTGYIASNALHAQIDPHNNWTGVYAGSQALLMLFVRRYMPKDWAGGLIDGAVIGATTWAGVHAIGEASKQLKVWAGINGLQGLPFIGSYLDGSHPLGAQQPNMPVLNQI